MNDLNVIDRFTDVFSRYIDSGFGLLAGDVAFLTGILVALDIVLAGLFWALVGEDNVPAQLIRKVLYVGFFAFVLQQLLILSRHHLPLLRRSRPQGQCCIAYRARPDAARVCGRHRLHGIAAAARQGW